MGQGWICFSDRSGWGECFFFRKPAAYQLCGLALQPLLERRGLVLGPPEARVALLHLPLQLLAPRLALLQPRKGLLLQAKQSTNEKSTQGWVRFEGLWEGTTVNENSTQGGLGLN